MAGEGGGVGLLDRCLGIGVPLRVCNPDPVKDKKDLNTYPE